MIKSNGKLEKKIRPTMGNPVGRMWPFKLFTAALVKPQKCQYFIEKSTK
jgi:hypothetical protein